MFQKLLYIIILTGLLAGCRKSDIKPRLPYESELRRLVVVYMTAENSLSTYANADLNEMRQGIGSIPEDCALAVYFDNADRSQNPAILLLDSKNGERTLHRFTNDPISSDSAAMLSTLRMITRQIKAREYALVLWGHGSGWQPARVRRKVYGPDNGQNGTHNAGLWMETHTLHHVLQQTGVHWRYIFSDVCFMQSMAQAYELRDVTDWHIASPVEIPGYGAPYNTLMPHLFDATDFARTIPQHYREQFPVLVSSVQSDRLEALARTTAAALDTLGNLNTRGVQRYPVLAPGYTEQSYYDLRSLMAASLSEADYARWLTVFDQAVPYRFSAPQWESLMSGQVLTDGDHYGGVAIFLPYDACPPATLATWRALQWAREVFPR